MTQKNKQFFDSTGQILQKNNFSAKCRILQIFSAKCLFGKVVFGEVSRILLNRKKIVMNFSALYSTINVVHPLKSSMSSDKPNSKKTSSMKDRGHLISDTIGIMRVFCCFHPL